MAMGASRLSVSQWRRRGLDAFAACANTTITSGQRIIRYVFGMVNPACGIRVFEFGIRVAGRGARPGLPGLGLYETVEIFGFLAPEMPEGATNQHSLLHVYNLARKDQPR